MKSIQRQTVLATLFATSLGLVSYGATAAAVSQEVIESRQESQIWTTYALSPYLRANDLKVVVHGGKATLSGTVEEEVNKDLAKEIALGVNGIKTVDNQIVVQADYIPSKNARKYGDLIDDATITTAVKSRLLWSKYADSLNTKVQTQLGRVTLSGTAETAAAKSYTGQLVLTTRGVVSLNNQLVVNDKDPSFADSAKRNAKATGQDIADGWITTKVKSSFLYSSNISGSDISVSTKKGIVTLNGKLASGAEQALAVEIAQNVRGVKSVQSKGLTF